MELIIPLERDLSLEHDVFGYGDLTGHITVVDKAGKEDKDYSIKLERDNLFKDEWKVTIQTKPEVSSWFKFKSYWFKYNTKTKAFVGDTFFLTGFRKRFIYIALP